MKKTTILLDAGGTLVGADNLFSEISRAFEPHFISIDAINREFCNQKNLSANNFKNVKQLIDDTCKAVAEQNSIPSIEFSPREIYRHIYTNTVYLYEGVLETLSYFKKMNFNIILVSDADADVLVPQFLKLGIDDFFDKKIISSDIGAYKPSDEIVKAVQSEIQNTAHDLWFIGDSVDDVQTAKKLGAKSIYIGATNTGATYTVSSFSKVLSIFDA